MKVLQPAGRAPLRDIFKLARFRQRGRGNRRNSFALRDVSPGEPMAGLFATAARAVGLGPAARSAVPKNLVKRVPRFALSPERRSA